MSDWVLYDNFVVPTGNLFGCAFPPVIPSLLESLGRSGGSSNTPGDVLADGPGFDPNGHLFEPYFTDVFAYAFSLNGRRRRQHRGHRLCGLRAGRHVAGFLVPG